LEAVIEAFLSDEPYLLLIEEINRANAPAVFGEVFQLLDRKNGVSNYKVALSAEAMLYLQDKLGKHYSNISEGIYLPPNLYLWATMNSADQGVFHLDSAFKRRWGFEYLPLNENENKCAESEILFCGKRFNWNLFRNVLNSYLGKVCNITEDRLIGPFFLTNTELLEEDSIKNKLLLYLRDDVLRHNHRKLFISDTFSEVAVLFDSGTDVFVQAVMEQLIIQENTTIEQ
jgi:5-methylcytosine-specific restriction endonuclease McrBC GTP-binding regulatory subunit McrB